MSTCPKCGCEILITSNGFKPLCRCENPKMYDILKSTFDKAFEDEEESE